MSASGDSTPDSLPAADRDDLGFGSVVSRQSRERLLNRDGSFNVRREGLGFFRSLSVYQWLLEITWTRFLLVLAGSFLLFSLFFAIAFYLCGPGALVGAPTNDDLGRLLANFSFSIQTLATIGYGGLAPARPLAHALVVLEAVSGVLLVALGAGISFARFARPRARILFSDRAVIGPYGSGTAFMFRIANARSNELLDVQARLLLVLRKQESRVYYSLDLERDGVLFFPLSWTVVHPIDDSSPLAGLGPEELATEQAEFLVLLSGTDETFATSVHARTSYDAGEVAWNARFVSLFNPADEDGIISIDVQKLSAVEPL